MPIAKVQDQRSSTNNKPSVSVTMIGPVVAGNVWSAYCRAGVALAGITPPAGWTARKTQDDGTHSVGIWDHVVAGGDSQIVTFAFSPNTDATLEVFELSGVDAALADGTSSSNPGSVLSAQPGPITPTTAGDCMILGLSTLTSNGGGQTVNSGFIAVVGGGNAFAAYKIKTDSGAENPLASWNTAADAAVVMVAYKAGDAGPGGGGGGGGTTLTPLPWQPWNPLTVGLDWVPRVNPAKALDNDGGAWVERFTSTVAETIDELQIYVPTVPGVARIAAEIFERGDEPCGVETTDAFRPSADVSNTNPVVPTGALWRNVAGITAAGTLFQSIDEVTIDFADYLAAPGSAYGAELRMRMASAGFASGRRVTQVRIHVAVFSEANQLLGLKIRNPSGGTEWQDEKGYGPGAQALIFILPEICPFTQYPWTEGDIDAFATGYEVAIYHPTTNPQESRVFQLWMEVDSVPENRVAVTSGIFAQGATGWAALDLRSPTGADNWAKAADIEYSIALRRITDRYYPGGSALWAYLDLGDGCPLAGHHAAYWLVDAKGCYSADTEVEFVAPAFAVNLIRTDTDVSVDSQPYAVLGVADVMAGLPVSQTMTMPGGAFGRIRARVKRSPETIEPLTVQLAGRGTPVTMTVEEFDLLPDATSGWKLLDLEMDAAASVAPGALVSLEFSTTDTFGWQVTYLDTMGTGDDVTFGGTTDRATIAGVDYPNRDLIVTTSTLPATPSAFTTEVQSAGLASPMTFPVTIDYVRMTWSASTLPPNLFSAYVVERWDPIVGLWRPIARLIDPTKPVFHDFEGRRGIAISYRARTERADGALSQGTLEASATPAGSRIPYLLLVSNEDPGRNMCVVRLDSPDFTFLDAGRDQLRALYGRDYQVALRERETRGDRLNVPVLVARDGPPENDLGVMSLPLGRSAFDELLALSRAEASYICVLDHVGGRWFSHLGVGAGKQDFPWYTAPLQITEITATPSTPNVVPADFTPPPPPESTGPPTFRSVTNVTNTGTVTKPAGTAQHDALIILVWGDDSTTSPPSASGFSLIAFWDGTSHARGVFGLLLKYAGASEGASYTVTIPGATGSAISMAAYQPTSAVDPLLVDVGVFAPNANGSPHNITATSIDVDAPSTLLFLSAGPEVSPFTAPSGMTSRAANFRSPVGATLIADQGVAIGATGDRLGLGNGDGGASILVAFKGVASVVGPGLPPPDPGVGPVGYIGCSNSHQSVNGYERAGGTRMWDVIHGYSGGVTENWTDPNSKWWTEFRRGLSIMDQPVAIWWQFCEHNTLTLQADIYAAALLVLAIIQDECPNVPVYASALNGYDPPNTDVPSAAIVAAVAQLVSNGLVYAGPLMDDVKLTAAELEEDLTHPNSAGELRMGQALKAFWD